MPSRRSTHSEHPQHGSGGLPPVSRRTALGLLTAGAAGPALTWPAPGDAPGPAAHRGMQPVVRERVAQALSELPFESIRIDGPLTARLRVNVEGRLLHVDETACLAGFRHRDGAGSFDDAWTGEHAGKFLDAACNALHYHDDARLRAIADRMVAALLASQAPDGYLGTYPAAKRWTGWDVWVHKYTLIGLLSYYELTGKPAVLSACKRIGDLLARTFGEGPGQRNIVAAGEHLGMAATSVLEPMCRLYRCSASEQHLALCQAIVRAAEKPGGPRILSSLLSGTGVHEVANGKAYEMLSNFNGLIDLYRLTGEADLLQAVLQGWEDIVRTQRYPTGTVSAAEHFQPPGRLLSLQSSNVGETCATVTWLQLNARLLRLTGAARFGHEIERTVYNHLLAAQDPVNGDIAYYTALTGPREFTHALLCCVSSGPRGISLIPRLAWLRGTDSLLLNLFVPGRVRTAIGGAEVTVECRSGFPLLGSATLQVRASRAVPFALRLRVPSWCTNFTAQAGGRIWHGTPGQILELARTWETDAVEIALDLPVQTLDGAPAYPGWRLLQRGPQVLALEQTLNPSVPWLQRAALPQDGQVSLTTAQPQAAVQAPAAAEGSAVREGGSPPPPWRGPVFRLSGLIAQQSGGAVQARAATLSLVPFADVRRGWAWLAAPGALRLDAPAATAYVRASLSVLSLHLVPTATDPVQHDAEEYLTDENDSSWCAIDPEDPGLAQYLGAPAGRRGDGVWFGLVLPAPASISRVVFVNGPVSAGGGWFDTSTGPPRIEAALAPVPMSANLAVPDSTAVRWVELGAFTDYPRTDAHTPPDFGGRSRFELRLRQPLTVHGLRLIGRPGGRYASCACLSAHA